MRPVQEQPEPIDFEEKVRKPGLRFLKGNPKPESWKNREYWRQAIPDLWKAYNGICAYSCHWIPPADGSITVDHYIPKSIKPSHAYEWSNFRLSTPKMNTRKGTHMDVIDPFKLQANWFTLVFPGLLVRPESNLLASEKQAVLETIERLQLNADESLINTRLRWVLEYCDGHIDFDYLKRMAPFIAYEIERQDLKATICRMYQKRKI